MRGTKPGPLRQSNHTRKQPARILFSQPPPGPPGRQSHAGQFRSIAFGAETVNRYTHGATATERGVGGVGACLPPLQSRCSPRRQREVQYSPPISFPVEGDGTVDLQDIGRKSKRISAPRLSLGDFRTTSCRRGTTVRIEQECIRSKSTRRTPRIGDAANSACFKRCAASRLHLTMRSGRCRRPKRSTFPLT
jgi:hypothetical protein